MALSSKGFTQARSAYSRDINDSATDAYKRCDRPRNVLRMKATCIECIVELRTLKNGVMLCFWAELCWENACSDVTTQDRSLVCCLTASYI